MTGYVFLETYSNKMSALFEVQSLSNLPASVEGRMICFSVPFQDLLKSNKVLTSYKFEKVEYKAFISR